VQELVANYLEHDERFRREVRKGLASLDASRFVPHEEVRREMELFSTLDDHPLVAGSSLISLISAPTCLVNSQPVRQMRESADIVVTEFPDQRFEQFPGIKLLCR
jgi:hypothetical protein